MRKLLMLVTMLLVPTLASAWTLQVKVTNTTAGINAGNGTTLAVGAGAPVAFAVGQKYLYPTNSPLQAVTVVVANPADATVTLTGGTLPAPTPVAGGNSYVIAANAGKTLQQLSVVYAAAAAVPKTNISLTQATGGLLTLNVGASSTTSGYTNVAVGTLVTVKAKANTGWSIGSVTLDGVALPAPYTFTAAIPVAPAANVVTATFTKTPVITASLSLASSGQIGTPVTATATAATTGVAPLTYAWTVGGVAAGTASTQSVTPIDGQTIVQVVVSSADAASVTKSAIISGVNVTAAANYACTSCHAGSTPLVVSTYNSTGNTYGSTKTCADCHSATPHAVFNKCADCHANGGNHTFAAAPTQVIANNDCISCHDINIKHINTTNGVVSDNNGVRAIVGEFAKRSHHVTGRAVTNTDCAVCHLEGKRDGVAVVIDPLFHMASNKTYLRNGNTGLTGNQTKSVSGAYPWNPATPDNTLMDQFCFSCHNAAGAPTAAAALTGVNGYTGTALNPFGDSVSNDYDQVSRVNVVGVFEQFATTNSSHHAVRGAKYTASTLAGNAAVFTQISTTNYNNLTRNAADPIKGVKSIIGTMKDLALFTPTYTTLDGTALADNITIHCGDCHTVGQFRAADVGVKPFNNAVIGAHGSNNEYLLRNSNGDDTFNKDALVCFICHKADQYGQGNIGAHNNANPGALHCNSDTYNTAGLVGTARLAAEEGWLDGMTPEIFVEEVAEGKYGATGGAPIFGIKCINCHNASDKKTFGGIHGNAGNASYNSYSGAKLATDPLVVVTRKPYRFMPGLGNFHYNGGDSVNGWTLKALTSNNKQGCYTLNGASTTAKAGELVPSEDVAPTKALAAGANVSSKAIGSDNGILGSWGACTDHAGSSVFGGQHDPNRTILRPLSY